jgi:hypothetical protein
VTRISPLARGSVLGSKMGACVRAGVPTTVVVDSGWSTCVLIADFLVLSRGYHGLGTVVADRQRK